MGGKEEAEMEQRRREMIERDKFLFMFFPPRLRKEEDLFRPKRDKHFLSIFCCSVDRFYLHQRQTERITRRAAQG